MTDILQNRSKIFHSVKQFFNVLLMAISPMALLMLIVAFIMLLDQYGAHRRLREAFEESVQTTTAIITTCYAEERYCFADFIDEEGRERYGKLDWRYYSAAVTAELASLNRGDRIEVRYAQQTYENDIILAERYNDFRTYKGYYSDMGGIALVSWIILIIHPEIMLFSLIDDFGATWDEKWQRMTKPG